MTALRDKIRIAINISVTPGVSGGIAQSTQGLVSSVGQLDGPEEYVLIAGTTDQADWISQYRGPSHQIVVKPKGQSPNGSVIKCALWPALSAVRYVIGRLSPPQNGRNWTYRTGFTKAPGAM